MNDTLKAVIIEVSGGNVRNNHVNLRGAFGLFPDDCLGGSDESLAGKPILLQVGAETLETDIDRDKAIFRARGTFRRFFADEGIEEGDLVLIERTGERAFRVTKTSKRVFKHYL